MKKSLLSDEAIKTIIYISLYAFMMWIIFSVFSLKAHHIYNFPLLRVVIVFFASVLLTKYFFYMVISPWHDVVNYFYNKKHKDVIAKYKPLVSVMIPAWNESKGVLNTIKTILENTYCNLEIIVVNDGSTDESDQLIKEFIKNYNNTEKIKNDIKIIYEYKENGGKGSALNKAIELSHGEILISIDADCIVATDTIKNFVVAFANPKVMAAVGNVKIGNIKKIIGVIQYLEYLFSFYFKKAESIMNSIYIIGGAAGAFRREVFEKIGLYNTNNITEDIDLSVRIQDAGMKIVYVDKAIVYTEGAETVDGLNKQRFRWKHGRFNTFKENRHLFFSTNKRHNKILSWFILPLAIFGELQISLELFFILFLYLYAFLTNDFSSFISGVVVVGAIFFVQIFFDNQKDNSLSFYILVPIGWLLFYLTSFIEWKALFTSIKTTLSHQKPKWQRWNRQGLKVDLIKKS